MATANSTDLVPCVVYYRCSSPQQELSVDEQRAEVVPYLERKGYFVVREYIDQGKSASKNPHKRTAFNRMIADAPRQEFEVVVCYDAARFTRFDNIEGSLPKQVLRTNGVILDTTKEGEFDWRTPEGRWKDMAYCESNRAMALNISKDALRGRKAVLELGYWPNGDVPYGYDREYTDGVRTAFVGRNETFRKGRNWHLRLVVNEVEAAVVREVFQRYTTEFVPMRQIAIDLNARGVPPPRGQNRRVSRGAWDGDGVATILRDRAYVGVASIGHGRRSKAVHNHSAALERPNSCPPVVDPAVWHEAQQARGRRRQDGTKPQPSRAGILSGFLVCGHCRYRMRKHPAARVTYTCISASDRPHLGCRFWRAYEDELLPRVCAWLAEEVDAELIQALQASPPGVDGRPPEEAVLADSVKALGARVANASESALLAPPAAREAAWALVAQWQEELDGARQQLALVQAVQHAPELADFKTWWDGVKHDLIHVAGSFYRPTDAGPEEAAGAVCVVSGTPGGPAEACTVALVEKVSGEAGAGPAGPSEGVLLDKDRLRALLSRLGFLVRVWFKETGKVRPRWAIKDVQIEASVDLNASAFEAARTSTDGIKRLTIRAVYAFAG